MSPLEYWNDSVVLDPLTEAFPVAAAATAELAKRLAPRRTGTLAGAVKVTPTSPTSARLEAPGVPYLGPVVKGSRAHTEYPKTKLALKTPYGIFASVEHPAVPPRPFLNEAAAAFHPFYIVAAQERMAWVA